MIDEDPEEYWDFIKWHLEQEHLTLESIPKQEGCEFWAIELDEDGHDVSAFNTQDFEKHHPFNKYQYKLKKIDEIYEKVKDLAITYSCISDEQGKKNVYQRCKNLVEKEFKDKGTMLLEYYKKYSVWTNKYRLFMRIKEINSRINKCRAIWRKYANWE